MLTYTFPTNFELDLLAQELVIDPAAFIGVGRLAPVRDFLTQRVQWEQLDLERGMTAPHNMETDPKIDTRPGATLREYDPIAFKESDLVKEKELLRAREIGTINNVVSLDRLIARIMAARRLKTWVRMEWAIWAMFGGALAIDENGVKVSETFPVQTFATVVPWATHATATPLLDIINACLKFRGTGASGQGGVIYINQTDLNDLLQNKNNDDLWGFRGTNFVSLTYSLEQVNAILSGRGLPTIELYDQGYIAANGIWTPFIANGHPVLLGKRVQKGQVVANFASTPSMHRTVNGLWAPGYFSILEINGGPNTGAALVNADAMGNAANPNLKITGGIYGGPILWYPLSVIALDVTHTGA
jgi:major capsid protein E